MKLGGSGKRMTKLVLRDCRDCGVDKIIQGIGVHSEQITSAHGKCHHRTLSSRDSVFLFLRRDKGC